ncbi:MAG: hypothetical protein SFW66_03570 [Gammaproteobacteria bacterium]|nr:hypothetical protein [Gammaproteobacteria bacterium]
MFNKRHSFPSGKDFKSLQSLNETRVATESPTPKRLSSPVILFSPKKNEFEEAKHSNESYCISEAYDLGIDPLTGEYIFDFSKRNK